MLSALEHYAYCPRQCGLIDLEQVFDENLNTLKGHMAHERADTPTTRSEEGMRVERGLPLWSRRLELTGRADIVEWHGDVPYPVEYKVGRRREWTTRHSRFARRGCAWKRCWTALCRRARCITSARACGMRWSSTIRCGAWSSARRQMRVPCCALECSLRRWITSGARSVPCSIPVCRRWWCGRGACNGIARNSSRRSLPRRITSDERDMTAI